MAEQPQRPRLRIELTRRQKEQIRDVTGREVNALDLCLEGIPEPPHPLALSCSETDRVEKQERSLTDEAAPE